MSGTAIAYGRHSRYAVLRSRTWVLGNVRAGAICLRAAYAMSSTEIAASCLRAGYAVSGTEIAYAEKGAIAEVEEEEEEDEEEGEGEEGHFALGARCAVLLICSTLLICARCAVLRHRGGWQAKERKAVEKRLRGLSLRVSPYPRATLCPVLTWRMRPPAWYAMSGTDMQYGVLATYGRAMRCPILTNGRATQCVRY
eukprot:3940391-Rhodomonas_salina.6